MYLSGVPEVDVKIRKLVQAIFRSQGMIREYFTDLFPYMREAVRKFNVEGLWNKVYADVVTGDYEMDRLGLFLNHLYKEEKDLFLSFLNYVTIDVLDRFHEPSENLSRYFRELEAIGYVWKNRQFMPLDS